MLYNEQGQPVMYKDLPTAEQMHLCNENLFSAVMNLHIRVLELKKVIYALMLINGICAIFTAFLTVHII